MFWYKGNLMTSEELASHAIAEGITGHDITNRINEHGWDIETALSKPKINKGALYEYRGKQYTAKELVKLSPVKGMTLTKMLNRLNHHHWSAERAVNQPLDTKIQPFGIGERIYEYNGQMYNSYELYQFCPIKDQISQTDIVNRINHHGWDIKKALSTPLKGRSTKYEYNGGLYDTTELLQFAVDSKIANHDITSRLRSGWTVWEAINIPKGITRKRYYKTQ